MPAARCIDAGFLLIGKKILITMILTIFMLCPFNKPPTPAIEDTHLVQNPKGLVVKVKIERVRSIWKLEKIDRGKVDHFLGSPKGGRGLGIFYFCYFEGFAMCLARPHCFQGPVIAQPTSNKSPSTSPMQNNPKLWAKRCISSPRHVLDQAPRAKKSWILTRF